MAMEWWSVGIAVAGAVLVIVGYCKKSEAQDFSVRIVVFGVYCFVVALTAMVVMEHEKNDKLVSRVSALEAQLAKSQNAKIGGMKPTDKMSVMVIQEENGDLLVVSKALTAAEKAEHYALSEEVDKDGVKRYYLVRQPKVGENPAPTESNK